MIKFKAKQLSFWSFFRASFKASNSSLKEKKGKKILF